jgi:protocatechuate 3,4-dioxygenase beta subunit
VYSGDIRLAPVINGFLSITKNGQKVSYNVSPASANVTISGEAFNDLNGDGELKAGEPGLPGWTIDLVDQATGAIVAETTSGAGGQYSFTDAYPGSYTIAEKQRTGWSQTAPAAPGTYSVFAFNNQSISGQNFGNFQTVTVSGTVFNDLNGDGSNDGGTDPGLRGWTINLLDTLGNTVATTTSAADGTYSFPNLGPGTYTIQEVHQNGYVQTQPVDPSGTYTVQAVSGTNPGGLDFGNFQLVSVSGNVYNDLDGNGSQGAGEPGLLNWQVDVINSGGNVAASAVTDASGNYTITGVGPGSFTLQEVVQGGWNITQPTSPSHYSFTTSSGVNVVGGIFGNFQLVSVSGNVYNDLKTLG